jgi:hypothetical protein
MSSISNIDDLLMGVGNSQQPATPEHKDMQEVAEIEEMESDVPDYSDDQEVSEPKQEPQDDESDAEHQESDDDTRAESEQDEYGNEKEVLSKSMQKRLERQAESLKRKHEAEINQLRAQLQQQGASQQVQQAAKDFEYDPEDSASWQQQLTQFVQQTVTNMNQQAATQQRQAEEQKTVREFEEKFVKGMDRFPDFVDIVGSQPVDDAMTMALRGMQDPAAFIYAASKRQPQELERISKLRDPYARMVEMGKLEERMRRNKPVTKAPRPLGKAPEDATTNAPKKAQEKTGDDLLANADAKRLNTVRTRLRNNR